MALRPLTPLGYTTPRGSLGSGILGELPSLVTPKKRTSGLTPAQAIALYTAIHNQKKHGSFLGSITHPVGHGLGWTLDKTMRPIYGIANMYDEAIKARNRDHRNHSLGEAAGIAGHGFLEGFLGHKKTTFSDVLNEGGVLKKHDVLRGLAGFGMDVALDPTTYVGVGAAGKLGGKLGVASKTVIDGTRSKEMVEPALRVQRMGKLLDATTKLKQGGEAFKHREALGKLQIDFLAKQGRREPITEESFGILNLARDAAKEEAKLHDPRFLHIRVGKNRIPTALPLPKTKLGQLGIPVVSPVAASLGKAFKPGYEDPLLHRSLLTRRHISERLAHEYFGKVRDRMGKFETMSQKEQLSALHFFEKPHGRARAVIKVKGDYVINPAHIERARKAGLTEKQIDFVKGMHDIGEEFARLHKAHGLEFEHMGAKGKLYVPHVVQRSGEALTDAQQNLLSKRGWLKERTKDLSVAELHGLHKAGALPKDIETNPYKLLAIHTRSVANQHADQELIKYWTRAMGKPTRLVDAPALERTRKAITAKKSAITKYKPYDQAAHDEAALQARDLREAEANRRIDDYLTRNAETQRAHLEGDWTQTTAATVAKLAKNAERAKENHALEVQTIRDMTHPAVRKDLKALSTAKGMHTKGLNKLNRELAKLQKQERQFMKGTKNPEFSAQAMTVVSKLKNEHGHSMAFPKETAHAMERLHKVMAEDDETLNAFSNGYRKYLGKWKLGVTSVNPGYGVRNTLSDFWNMWLAGVPVHGMVTYGGKAARLMRKAQKGDVKAVHEMLDAYDQGILSGLFAGDVQQVSNMLEHGSSLKGLAHDKRFIKLTSKMMQDFNRNRENWGRLTHYMYQREALKRNITDAAHEVKKAHFDYEDLTPFEQRTMKVIAPFYTWSRKNIPYQIEKLVTEPGRFSAFPKFVNEMDKAAGGSQGDIVPDYMNKGMYLKMPFGGGKYMAPMIGVTDLERATHPVDLATSLVSPAAKIPFEMMANRNLLTGQDIAPKDSYSRNPINDNPLVSGLLSLIPGSNVGGTGRMVGDKMVQGKGANPYLTYLMGQTPLTNMLVNKTGKIRTAQQQGNKYKALESWLTGVNPVTVDQEQQKAFARLDFEDQIKQIMKDLRAQGYPQPKKRKRSRNQKVVDAALFKSLTGGGR